MYYYPYKQYIILENHHSSICTPYDIRIFQNLLDNIHIQVHTLQIIFPIASRIYLSNLHNQHWFYLYMLNTQHHTALLMVNLVYQKILAQVDTFHLQHFLQITFLYYFKFHMMYNPLLFLHYMQHTYSYILYILSFEFYYHQSNLSYIHNFILIYFMNIMCIHFQKYIFNIYKNTVDINLNHHTFFLDIHMLYQFNLQVSFFQVYR